MAEEKDDEVKMAKKKKPFKGKFFFVGVKEESVMNIPSFGKTFNFGKVYESFKMSLSSKRTFNRSILSIEDDNNRVLNHHFNEKLIDVNTDELRVKSYNKKGEVAEKFILNYFSLKMNLDDGGDLTRTDYIVFITELMNILDDDILKIISNYVDSVYDMEMDEVINKSFDKDTTFYDSEIKQLCHVKFAGNLIVPLCTHYCNIMSRDVDPKEFFLELYKELFNRVSVVSQGMNCIDKLHRYVTMIVSGSFKSNKKIYDRMSISGTTKDSEVEDVFSKILTTIITKLEPSGTVPAFIAETVKRSSSQYKPRENDGYDGGLNGFSDDYVHSGGDDSVVTEAERAESRIARPDELLKVIRKNTCDDTINKISIRYNIGISSIDEWRFTVENMNLHEYQNRIIFQCFHNEYGGYENMFDNNRHNYSRLLLLTDKYLRSIGLNIIADYTSSDCIGYSFQNRWGGKVSDRKLFEDPRYIELINGKYRYIRDKLESKNFIRDDAVFLANNLFKYNGFMDPRFGETIKHSDDEIINAVLDYYIRVIV